MWSESDPRLKTFETLIAEQEELLYGFALYFEGLSLLHAGQDAVLETHRKQFRNLIQAGSAEIQRARELLEEARANPMKLSMVEQFAFHLGDGHPDPAGLRIKAKALVTAYGSLFPGRPREQALDSADTMKLLAAASRGP